MTQTPTPIVQELIDRCTLAFRAAQVGPDTNGHDRNAPTLDDYLCVLQGRKLFMTGWAIGHPRLGTTLIGTSMLIHVTEDAQWGRTLSRWYRLGEPRRIDTSQLSPDIILEGYCPSVGLDGLGIPLRLARMVMAKRPAELSRVALEHGLDEQASALARIEKNWPPQANFT